MLIIDGRTSWIYILIVLGFAVATGVFLLDCIKKNLDDEIKQIRAESILK